jgi:hypothetical protein
MHLFIYTSRSTEEEGRRRQPHRLHSTAKKTHQEKKVGREEKKPVVI